MANKTKTKQKQIGSHRLNTSSNFFMLMCLLTYVHKCFLESYRITILVACSKN